MRTKKIYSILYRECAVFDKPAGKWNIFPMEYETREEAEDAIYRIGNTIAYNAWSYDFAIGYTMRY